MNAQPIAKLINVIGNCMPAFISDLPRRQKFLLILTLSGGVFIWFCSLTNSFSYDTINTFIFIYSFAVPFLFLGFSTIIDLNDNKVFLAWFVFSIILLLITIVTKNDSQFIIHRSAQFDKSSGVNSFMADHSTVALKSLFFFLAVYWILNKFSKRLTGNFIVNTFWQMTW